MLNLSIWFSHIELISCSVWYHMYIVCKGQCTRHSHDVDACYMMWKFDLHLHFIFAFLIADKVLQSKLRYIRLFHLKSLSWINFISFTKQHIMIMNVRTYVHTTDWNIDFSSSFQCKIQFQFIKLLRNGEYRLKAMRLHISASHALWMKFEWCMIRNVKCKWMWKHLKIVLISKRFVFSF